MSLQVHVDSGKPSRPSTRQVAPAANARGRTRAAATDRWGNESEEDDDGDDDGSDKGSSDDDEDSYGGARQQWRPSLARKSQRKRVKVQRHTDSHIGNITIIWLRAIINS